MQIAEADRFIKKIKELQQFLINKITWAQSVYKAIVNKKQTPVLVYQISNFVWLNIRNLNIKQPTKKLNWKNAGPYKVKKVISSYTY